MITLHKVHIQFDLEVSLIYIAGSHDNVNAALIDAQEYFETIITSI